MNLGDLIGKVQQHLRYKPAAAQHRLDLKNEINDVYMELMSSQRWEFLYRIVDFSLYASDTGNTGAFTQNGFSVTATTTQSWWLGKTLIGPDGEEYRIAKIESGTELRLSTAYAGTTTLAGEYEVRPYDYLLPEDLDSIVAFIDRSQDVDGVVPRATLAQERQIPANDTETGGRPELHVEAPREPLRSPRGSFAAATSSGGSLAVGQKRKYLYVFEIEGRQSGRSVIVEATPAGANQTIDLSGIEDRSADSTGYIKKIYVDTDESGLYRFLATLDDSTTTYSDDGVTDTADENVLWREAHARRSVRFWPRVDQDYTLELQYHLAPRKLAHDTDVPVFDRAFHQVLVELTLLKLAPRMEMSEKDRRRHEKERDRVLRMMRRRHLDEPANSTRMQAYDFSLGDNWRYNTGEPSVS